jgi:hypothetical protein
MNVVKEPDRVERNMIEEATDAVLDGACAGWDATVFIADPGDDPFAGVDDDDLLHANAGVLAATVLAQSNQMRVLDSAIVPDSDLVRVTAANQGKFNEFDVYTPTTSAERYSVINEDGVEEVIVTTSAFYPGLADRPSSTQTAIQLKLEDESADPYRVALATGTALLQVGIEAGRDVGPVAEILNRAWGVDAAFSPGTVVGVAGTHDYASIFAQDRNSDARRLASWQERSYVRSGQLAMTTDDWGANLHCDFRRVRVAAESTFAASLATETLAGGKKKAGKITYHVPSTSLLSADPAYLFFQDAQPDLLSRQVRCPAAKVLLTKVDQVGILSALWPSTDPIIAATWAATFHTAGGLARAPVAFAAHQMTASPLFSSATSRLVSRAVSFARGTGRTCMTALSAKVAGLADNVVSIQAVSWFSRLAAVVEMLRLSTDKSTRASMIKSAWSSLAGNIARDLERGFTTAQMKQLKAILPGSLKGTLSDRSSKIPVYALLWEIGAPKTAKSHTVLRGMRRGMSKAREVAMKVTLREKIGWRAGSDAMWLKKRLDVLKEFWAVQYAALSAVKHVAGHLRSDVRWWIEVATAVNLFRAGIMRGFDIADAEDAVAFNVDGINIRLKPYHAAAHLRKSLELSFAKRMPAFPSNGKIEDWTRDLAYHTIDYAKEQMGNLPRVAATKTVSAHTHHYTRGAFLLAKEGALGDWIDATISYVAEDCVALLEHRDGVMNTVTNETPAAPTQVMTAALEEAAERMAEAMAQISVTPPAASQYEWISDEVHEDAWDDFCEAEYDSSHDLHADAVTQMAMAKACTDPAAAAAIVRWVNATFLEAEEETTAAIV